MPCSTRAGQSTPTPACARRRTGDTIQPPAVHHGRQPDPPDRAFQAQPVPVCGRHPERRLDRRRGQRRLRRLGRHDRRHQLLDLSRHVRHRRLRLRAWRRHLQQLLLHVPLVADPVGQEPERIERHAPQQPGHGHALISLGFEIDPSQAERAGLHGPEDRCDAEQRNPDLLPRRDHGRQRPCRRVDRIQPQFGWSDLAR